MSSGSTKINIAAATVFLAIVAALSAYLGAKLIESPAVLSVGWVSFIIVMATVADSFAGERERHTLETLLASAIPDEALLLGKITASVAYGWFAALLLLAVMLIGANLTAFPVFYAPSVLLGALLVTPLALLAFSTAGVLLSMHAPTVRDAQTRLAALLFGTLIPLVALRPFVPDAIALLRTEAGRVQSMIANIVLFAIIDALLLTLAVARFKRARLITR